MRNLTLVAACATAALLVVPIGSYAACGDGVIDAGEQCDGGPTPNVCCSATCVYALTKCRASTAPCDPPEYCTGISDECPEDAGPADGDGDGVCDYLDVCRFLANPEQNRKDCEVKPLRGTPDLLTFIEGENEFTQVETIETGLGPVFNGRSCVECHHVPMMGGASERFVTRFGRYESGTFDPMTDAGGLLLQAKGLDIGTCAVAGEIVPAQATVSIGRITPPVLGAGFIDAMSDETILSHADPADADGDGISGRPNMIGGAIGRFGWKAQVATLLQFAGEAYRDELGITSPNFPDESSPQGGPVMCDTVFDPEDTNGNAVLQLAHFMAMLPPLKPKHVANIGPARRLFSDIGCESCHVSKMRTGDNPLRPLRRRRASLFSDLLLHDMGPALADGIEEGEATGSEFRTAPLWGVGRRRPYLHDGRATTLLDAIMEHGGEAQAARDRFAGLAAEERDAIIAFLSSL